MKYLNSKLIFITICFVLLAIAGPARAEETKTIHLKVAAFDNILFDNDFTVNACPDSNDASSTNLTVNAWCATNQLISSQGWSATSTWYSYGIMLNSINQYDGSDGNYWLWFNNSEIGATALNQHLLADGENLLLVYGTGPLKISVSSTTPAINSTSTVSASYFDTNAWQWQLAASSTFVINNREFSSADGTFGLFISTSSPYSIFGRKTGYLDSSVLILNGIIQDSTSTEPISTSTPPTNTPTPPNSNPGSADSHQTINVGSAINFLISRQNSDGSIGSSVLYSDWTAIAFAAYGDNEIKNKLKDYLIGAGYNIDFGSPITNLERKAMALMALGVNPYNGTKTDYISQIVSAFDGGQIGDPGIFNDDIFALFSLLKAGYSGSDPVINAAIKFIISKQNTDGSWGSVDLTAAVIQALVLAQKTGNLNTELQNSINQSLPAAKNFLRKAQGTNGGFSNNSFSTSWAIQAIVALGEPVFSWENSGKNPIDFLASYQKTDGGFENESTAVDTRIWATAYAIPAALNKTWDDILNNFPKQTPTPSAAIIMNNSSEGNNSTSTPNISITTSTPIIENTTSTATSTPVSVPLIKIEIGSSTPEEITVGNSVMENRTQNENIPPAAAIPAPTEQNNPETIQTPQLLEAKIPASSISQNLMAGDIVKITFYLSAATVISLGLYLVLKLFLVL